MSSQDVIVNVTHAVKRYSGVVAVNNISFAIFSGEIFGILGPNGAGKTTTIEMIATLRTIDEGSIFVDGIDVARTPQQIRRIIGVQPQTPAFEERTTLIETLDFFAATYGQTVNARELLRSVELEEKAKEYPENLSGGQRQRFSIAVGMVHKPKILFLDEPTTGLDPQARRHIWDLIRTIRNSGVTIILSTHYMEEAELLCDRVAVMDNGVVIALDTPKRLVKKLLEKGFSKPQHVEQANLEDVFIDLTGKALRE